MNIHTSYLLFQSKYLGCFLQEQIQKCLFFVVCLIYRIVHWKLLRVLPFGYIVWLDLCRISIRFLGSCVWKTQRNFKVYVGHGVTFSIHVVCKQNWSTLVGKIGTKLEHGRVLHFILFLCSFKHPHFYHRITFSILFC